MPINVQISIDLGPRQKRVLRAALVAGGVIGALGLGVVVAAPKHTFTSGTTISSSHMNENFADLDTRLTAVEAAGVPTGTIAAFAGDASAPPAGWLLCDGAAKSRTDPAFAPLFGKIGIRWGAGDGASTFNLPDLRGRFLRGVDGGAARDPDRATRTGFNGGTGVGDNVGSLQDDQIKAHNHPYLNFSDVGLNRGAARGTNNVSAERTDDDLTNGPKETRPKNANVNFIIKL
jgi:microcystin-dependent protein